MLLVSAFFSGSETALMSLNRYRLQHRANRGDRWAKVILSIVEQPEKMLSTILIGNTLANLMAASLTTMLAYQWFGEVGVFPMTLFLTLCVLIFSEIIPKTYASYHHEHMVRWVYWPLKWMMVLFSPVVWFANLSTRGVLFCFGLKKTGVRRVESLSSEEVHGLIKHHSDIVPEQQNLLLNIFDLAQMQVDDAMVPRKMIQGIDLQEKWSNVLLRLKSIRHSVVIVYQGGVEQAVGYLSMYDIMDKLIDEGLTRTILVRAIKEVKYIPEGLSLAKQLNNFYDKQYQLAMVVDEYGDVQGMLRLDDILHFIMGAYISHKREEQPGIVKESESVWLVSGALSLRLINKLLKIELNVEGPNTLSGLVIEYLESIPNAALGLRLDGYACEIVEVSENQVLWVRFFLDVPKESYEH